MKKYEFTLKSNHHNPQVNKPPGCYDDLKEQQRRQVQLSTNKLNVGLRCVVKKEKT